MVNVVVLPKWETKNEKVSCDAAVLPLRHNACHGERNKIRSECDQAIKQYKVEEKYKVKVFCFYCNQNGKTFSIFTIIFYLRYFKFDYPISESTFRQLKPFKFTEILLFYENCFCTINYRLSNNRWFNAAVIKIDVNKLHTTVPSLSLPFFYLFSKRKFVDYILFRNKNSINSVQR